MKAILLSIKPEHALNILNGNKTLELRKSVPKSFKGWVYVYVTMGGKRLLYEKQPKHPYYMLSNSDGPNSGNGKVVVKFQVSGTTKYVDCSDCTNTENGYECENDFMYLLSVDPILRKATCLEADEIEEYGNGADLYAHHLTNVQPIEPMELRKFYKTIHYPESNEYLTPHICEYKNVLKCYMGSQNDCLKSFELTKAPQSFMTAWVKGE